jgi:hypothetical protein
VESFGVGEEGNEVGEGGVGGLKVMMFLSCVEIPETFGAYEGFSGS